MTSKQALSKIKNEKKYSDEVINAIEKDIKRLEKLEKTIVVLKDFIAVTTRRNEKFEYIPCIYSFGLNKNISQKEYELLNEVLLWD